jgi:hypothetical protein
VCFTLAEIKVTRIVILFIIQKVVKYFVEFSYRADKDMKA